MFLGVMIAIIRQRKIKTHSFKKEAFNIEGLGKKVIEQFGLKID